MNFVFVLCSCFCMTTGNYAAASGFAIAYAIGRVAYWLSELHEDKIREWLR